MDDNTITFDMEQLRAGQRRLGGPDPERWQRALTPEGKRPRSLPAAGSRIAGPKKLGKRKPGPTTDAAPQKKEAPAG